MALPFLPPDDIVAAFEMLSQHNLVQSEERIKQLVTYFGQTWMVNAAWPPTSWCVYRETVRTNNDVEGWHHRLNTKARRGQLDVYQLAPVLVNEAHFVTVQVALLSERRLRKQQRRRYAAIHGRLHHLWKLYDSRQTSPKKFFRDASRIYSPAAE